MDNLRATFDEIVSKLKGVKDWDRERVRREGKELYHFLVRGVFNQIPGVSAIAALIVGSWVSSTFTTSPVRATLARWRIMKGGTHVVSSHTYRFLSVVLPLVAAVVTMYAVHKFLKIFREQQLQKNILKISQLGKEIQALVDEKLAILEKAREAGLLSEAEFHTKKANLYATLSRIPSSQIRDLLIGKLTG